MRDELSAMTPRLRRYARALVSGTPHGCETSDTLVHATLMRAIGARAIGPSGDLPVRLYATITQLNRDLKPPTDRGFTAAGIGKRMSSAAPAPAPASRLATAILALPLEEREALLLVALEGFDHAMAARILRISKPVLFERLTRARTAVDRSLAAPVAPIPSGRTTRAPHLRLVVG